jgi:hypothetical protein
MCAEFYEQFAFNSIMKFITDSSLPDQFKVATVDEPKHTKQVVR